MVAISHGAEFAARRRSHCKRSGVEQQCLRIVIFLLATIQCKLRNIQVNMLYFTHVYFSRSIEKKNISHRVKLNIKCMRMISLISIYVA